MRGYTVFSLRLAHQLTKRGFEIIGTGINNRNPKYLCYHFEDSKELRAAIEEITALRQKEGEL